MPLEFRRCDAALSPARDLLAAVLAEYDVLAGRRLTDGIPVTPGEFSVPGGAYLVGFQRAAPACGGGFRALGGGIAETKRMYVLPELRGRGFGRALLAALEAAARERGHRVMRLDSTAATWPLYRDAGYHELPDYNGNPHADIWAEKPL